MEVKYRIQERLPCRWVTRKYPDLKFSLHLIKYGDIDYSISLWKKWINDDLTDYVGACRLIDILIEHNPKATLRLVKVETRTIVSAISDEDGSWVDVCSEI